MDRGAWQAMVHWVAKSQREIPEKAEICCSSLLGGTVPRSRSERPERRRSERPERHSSEAGKEKEKLEQV